MNARYSQESLCDCGFRALRDEIPLGTVYEIKDPRRIPGKLKCGGCGRVHDITLVWTEASDLGHAGWLPLEVFAA